MTDRKFFDKLKSISRKWKIIDGCIRSEGSCPICVVAGVKGYDYVTAGEKLGLGYAVIESIVWAADHASNTPYRHHLLTATNLEEMR